MELYHKITGIFLLALVVIQLTGVNCIDKDDIPFSDNLEQSLAVIHAGEPASIDDTTNHTDDGSTVLHECPCHFHFLPNPALVKAELVAEVVQNIPSYTNHISLLPRGISKPPRLV